MKKTTTKKKTNKKLISALGMFMLSAAMLGTSTYAWFTMNKKVTVNGMEVRTKVSSNLLIAETNAEANYGDSLTQSRKALLEPVSTINGTSFFYTLDAKADGDKQNKDLSVKPYVEYTETANPAYANTRAAKTNYDDNFNDKYGITTAKTDSDSEPFNTAYGYVDYTFYLKATSDEDNQQVVMTKCNLLFNDHALGTDDTSTAINDRAWRVAVFSQASAKDTATSGDGTLKSILAPANAANFSIVAGTSATVADAVKATNELADVLLPGEAVVIDSDVDAGVSKYYKVVVRLWLEGEDNTCNSETYAKLTNSYKLDLQFDLQANATGAVTQIGSAVPSN